MFNGRNRVWLVQSASGVGTKVLPEHVRRHAISIRPLSVAGNPPESYKYHERRQGADVDPNCCAVLK